MKENGLWPECKHHMSQPPPLYAICNLMLTSNVFYCLQISTMSPSLTEKISRLHRKNWIILENNSILACIVRSLLCFVLLFTQTISMIDCQSVMLCTVCKYYCLYKQFNIMCVYNLYIYTKSSHVCGFLTRASI